MPAQPKYGPASPLIWSTLNDSSTVATRTQRITSFESLVLSHIPYAQVRNNDLQLELAQYDGPGVSGIGEAKPLLHWYFGGYPFPITKAIKVDYTYIRTWDGSNNLIATSLLFGFQVELHRYGKGPLRPVPYISSAGHAGRSPLDNAASSFQQLEDTLAALRRSHPTTVIVGPPDFGGQLSLDRLLRHELRERDDDPMPAVPELVRGGTADVQLDGPAQDSDSRNIFQYTLNTLFNDQPRWGQLLWWYFGGQAQRITKAMRVPLAGERGALFVGFSGPGAY